MRIPVLLLTALAFAPANAQVPASTSRPQFEVASVKKLGPQDEPSRPQIDGQRFGYKGTLHSFIFQAYRPRCSDECDFRGAPSWIDKDLFAIEATMPPQTPPSSTVPFMQGKAPQISQMLRTLLEDRFKLQMHWDTQELSTYELAVDKNGSKLNAAVPSTGQQRANGFLSVPLPNGHRRYTITAMNSSLADFILMLGDFMDRPVVDRTNLQGNFDIKVEFESDQPDTRKGGGLAGMQAAMMDQLPAIIDAMRQQLGLSFRAAKNPIDALIIDHVEQPSEN